MEVEPVLRGGPEAEPVLRDGPESAGPPALAPASSCEEGADASPPSSSGRRCLPLRSCNHVSFVVSSLSKSLAFYRDLLGFIEVMRPSSFDFDGAWLYNYGIGIHLLKAPSPTPRGEFPINPKSGHLSFQAEGLNEVEHILSAERVPYVRQKVEEAGVIIDQLFFHDPDGNMIEICNCDSLPICPLAPGQCAGSRLRRSPSAAGGLGEPSFEQMVVRLQTELGAAPVTARAVEDARQDARALGALGWPLGRRSSDSDDSSDSEVTGASCRAPSESSDGGSMRE